MAQRGQAVRCKGAGEVIFCHTAKSSSLARGGKAKLLQPRPRPGDGSQLVGFKGNAGVGAAIDAR